MNPLLHWLTSPEWTHVVGALLHSLWQGAIIALALAILMRRLANPVTRYRCALVTLGLVVMAGIVTWAVLNAPKPAVSVAITILVTEPAAAPVATTALNPDSADKIIALGRMSPPPAPKYWIAWLAVVWMLGAVVMLLRAGIKVAGAEKLRRSCQPLNDQRMVALVTEARRAVGLVRQIRVAVTDKLTSPAVVGVIVPTLILPLSLFTALTPEQIRFILLHELAHIRRGDYFANLFQLLAEALLFFNPAVWWISHQIRREREASCDALAIELSGAPADYARTLVRVAENIFQPATNAALAFGDGQREPSSLADRVQRLLVPGYRPALRLTWRAMLASLIVGGTLLVLSAVGTRSTVGTILSPREKTASEPLVSSPLTNFGNNSTTTPVPATFTGIMTDPQFREVVKAINQRSGTNSPNEDQVTQLSNRRAQVLISAVEKNNIAAEIENQPGHISVAETTTGSITNLATNINATNLNIQQTSGPLAPLTNKTQEQQSFSRVTGKGRDAIVQKLDKIKFDKVLYRELPLFEVIRSLNAEARVRDPDRRGVNFVVNPRIPGSTNQISLANCPTINMDNEVIGISLRETLDIIVKVASVKIHYVIEDYAVVFGLGDPIEPLQMRIFDLNLDVISATLGAPPLARLTNNSQSVSNLAIDIQTNKASGLLGALRERIRGAGVDIDRPGVTIVLNGRERQGKLLVNATKKDLDTIEALLQMLSGSALTARTFATSTDEDLADLQLRVYAVDAKAMVRVLEAVGNNAGPGAKYSNDGRTLLPDILKFFAIMGVYLQPPKTMFFNEPKGQLLVRAMQSDLDRIEQVVQVLNDHQPQVNIKVRWVEFTQDDILGLGLDWFGNLSWDGNSPFYYRTAPSTNNPRGQFFGILSDTQRRVLLDKFMSQRDRAARLRQGDITTLSGRECRFQTLEMRTIVTGINPQALIPPGVNSTTNVLERQNTPFGQTFNVIPTMSPEEAKISLHVIAYANEFLGYGKAKSNVPVYVNGKKKAEVQPLPRYRAHQITNDLVLRDGQTLMLGNLPTTEIAKQPNGEFLTTGVTGNNTKFLFVFITPTIVDPAGNRVNPVEESLPSSPQTIR